MCCVDTKTPNPELPCTVRLPLKCKVTEMKSNETSVPQLDRPRFPGSVATFGSWLPSGTAQF